MPLIDELYIGGVWTPSAARVVPGVGTVLVSATNLKNGEPISDQYTLTLSNVASNTATVTVQTASPNNPVKGRVVNNVPLDGATSLKNIIPGIGLVFSSSGANANTVQVIVGAYLGTLNATGTGAGTPSAGLLHRVTNSGAGLISGAKAKLTTQAILVKKVGTVFGEIRPFADGATEKTAGSGSSRTMPYLMKTVNIVGSGAAKTADLQVDGVTLSDDSILDLTTGETLSGVALKAISPGNGYRIVSGPLTGLEFSLSASCAANDTANVLIFPSRFLQIAPDNAGAAGTYGTAPVDLTENGQAAGQITSTHSAYYWTRTLVPDGAGSESNPYPLGVSLQGEESGSAGWLS